MQNILSLIMSHLFILTFISFALQDRSKKKKTWLWFMSECSAYVLF